MGGGRDGKGMVEGKVEGTKCEGGKTVRGIRWEGEGEVRVAVGRLEEEEEGMKGFGNFETWREFEIREFVVPLPPLPSSSSSSAPDLHVDSTTSNSDGPEDARTRFKGWARRMWIEGAMAVAAALVLGVVVGGMVERRRKIKR
ncbi:hypothetical protein TrRE_jg1272 [Triparma retinervis]|uniref:Uncharacterized protein n=1 Tax=Triparma retinervis TaxID=2557542 RepID=A0A9W6ZKD3_9STRA|nr:hypothetical protein TrRE_jg1272 [Triparma retinervis]